MGRSWFWGCWAVKEYLQLLLAFWCVKVYYCIAGCLALGAPGLMLTSWLMKLYSGTNKIERGLQNIAY